MKPADDERIPNNRFGPERPPKYAWVPRPRHRRRPGAPTHYWRVRLSDLLPQPPPTPPKREPLPALKDEGNQDNATGQNTKET